MRTVAAVAVLVAGCSESGYAERLPDRLPASIKCTVERARGNNEPDALHIDLELMSGDRLVLRQSPTIAEHFWFYIEDGPVAKYVKFRANSDPSLPPGSIQVVDHGIAVMVRWLGRTDGKIDLNLRLFEMSGRQISWYICRNVVVTERQTVIFREND
jgi:hypothetical protein